MARISAALAVAVALAFALALAGPVGAQLPDKDSCVAAAESQSGNTQALAPCVNGPSAECCSTIKGFAGAAGPLANCLCYPDLLEQLFTTTESNTLARRFGVDRGLITNVLQSCGVPFAQGTGDAACPSGPGVSVTAPGTTVGVAPGGATSVTAPGTTVGVAPGGATSVTAPGTTVGVAPGGATSVTAPGTTVGVVPGGGPSGPAAAPPKPPAPAAAPPAKAPEGRRGVIKEVIKAYCKTHPEHPFCYCSYAAARQVVNAVVLAVALALALALTGPGPAAAQKPSLPDLGNCSRSLEAQSGNIEVLAPCVGGPSVACCSAVQAIAGPGAPLAYCLCFPPLLEQLYLAVETNDLATSAGLNRTVVRDV
ncbi:hypothetical protein TSOC_008761 [Tetrabaena socialis]|uniref:Bifunctional inhibitor/plant lipid transfer protein/seed storage helical domain-containing protein n=1 Tax=Tetrabaena socialis TaxID=47790 RepID=A0A2J7ZXN3_9CHLO|nr:hypothetical protein TSOC_008761 [Tetrabaena socialis]|eukprot:PNH05028.1 hypothetical protein TSOC_008761 [Tetrabaena socialis]